MSHSQYRLFQRESCETLAGHTAQNNSLASRTGPLSIIVNCLIFLSFAIGCDIDRRYSLPKLSEIEFDPYFVAAVQSHEVVIVKFGASWCGPCVSLDGELDKLARSIKVVKIDITDNQELASKFGVGSIPHLVLFDRGQPVDQLVGFKTAEYLTQWAGQSASSSSVYSRSTDANLTPAAVQTNPFVSGV